VETTVPTTSVTKVAPAKKLAIGSCTRCNRFRSDTRAKIATRTMVRIPMIIAGAMCEMNCGSAPLRFFSGDRAVRRSRFSRSIGHWSA
jgi:hypothetical protein